MDSAVGAGINVRYLNYPLPAHPHAEGAAIAALCADAEGHFHAMHERLMSSTEWQRDTNWVAEAKAVGIENIEAFQKCIHGDSVRIELAHERALADSLGISGTPMFVSQKSVHRGTATSRDLIELVGRE